VIGHSLGTRFAPKPEGGILFLEEVGEQTYRIDRILTQLRSAGFLDKLKGTGMIVDYLKGHGRVDPERVAVDHCEEHTIGMALDAGFWAAMTIYPMTKNSSMRVVDTLERFGIERIMVDASGDWGPSDPGTLPN